MFLPALKWAVSPSISISYKLLSPFHRENLLFGLVDELMNTGLPGFGNRPPKDVWCRLRKRAG